MIQQVTIFFWVVCQFISYFFADYSSEGQPVNWWDYFGWLWYKVGVLLLLICAVNKNIPKLNNAFGMLILFFIVKILWNVIAIIFDKSINDPTAIKVLFVFLTIFICKLIIQDKWQRQN